MQGDRLLWLCFGEFHPVSRGTAVVSAPVPKESMMMAPIDHWCTLVRVCAATLGKFAKATFDAMFKTYRYLTPEL